MLNSKFYKAMMESSTLVGYASSLDEILDKYQDKPADWVFEIKIGWLRGLSERAVSAELAISKALDNNPETNIDSTW